eukprot:1385804-Rhodomonas_salina.1
MLRAWQIAGAAVADSLTWPTLNEPARSCTTSKSCAARGLCVSAAAINRTVADIYGTLARINGSTVAKNGGAPCLRPRPGRAP